jgi:hypothetical protein
MAATSPAGVLRTRLFAAFATVLVLGSAAPSGVNAAGEAGVVGQMFAACRASGGHPAGGNYNAWVAGGGCVCPGSSRGSGQATCSGGGTAGGTPGGSSAEILGALAGQILACKLFGAECPPGMQPPPDNIAVRSGLARANAEQKQLLENADQDEAQRMAAARQRMLNVLDSGSGGLRMHSLDGDDDLQVEKGPGPFGSTEVRPIAVRPGADGSYNVAGLTPVERLSCATALLRGAKDLALPYDTPTRRDMSRDAGQYLTAAEVKRDCPTDVFGLPMPPQTPAAVEVEIRQRLVQSRLYERLYDDLAKVAAIDKDLAADQQKHDDALKAKAAAELKVQELKTQIAATPPAAPTPDKPAPDKPPPDDALLKEALAALAQSDSTLQAVDKALADKTAEKNKLADHMRQAGTMLDDANTHPENADALLKKLQ